MSSASNAKRIAQIRGVLQARDTEDLLEIWKTNDQKEWSPEAFQAIRSILVERHVAVPPQAESETDRIARAEKLLEQASIYQEHGDLNNALEQCELAIQIAPQFAAAHNHRGLLFDEMGDLVQAINAYQQAIRLDPTFRDAKENLREAEKERAEELSRQRKTEADRFARAEKILAQANVYEGRGDILKAIEQCELAIQIAPQFADAHHYRGVLFHTKGDIAEAIKAYQEALRLDPTFEDAKVNLREAAEAQAKESPVFQQESETQTSAIEGDIEIAEETAEGEFDENEDIPSTFYLSETSRIVRGWPGHRSRPNRSGFDPLETDFETAYMQGLLLRQLFTGTLHFDNPILLPVAGLLGVLAITPLIFSSMEFIDGNSRHLWLLLPLSPYWIPGLALLWSVLRNVWELFLREKPEEEPS